MRFQQKEIKRQKGVYFVFIMFCYVISIFVNLKPSMKKSLLSILFVCFSLLGIISLSGEDHKHKLHEIGERIKQAVKAGKITEKEGWAKWNAVLREHGHDEDDHDDHHDEDDWEEAEELEREIEIRELEFELERLEHEHEMERMEWNHERERMERDFDRERREWDMENMQWDMRRKQIEMQMRGGPRPGGMPPHGARPPHGMKPPHLHRGSGPKPDMRRGGPPRGMMLPMSREHGHDHAKKPCDSKRGSSSSAKGKSDCGKSPCEKKEGKSCCGKCKAGCDKKESCKKGECKKSESCPNKKEDCPKKKRKK